MVLCVVQRTMCFLIVPLYSQLQPLQCAKLTPMIVAVVVVGVVVDIVVLIYWILVFYILNAAMEKPQYIVASIEHGM